MTSLVFTALSFFIPGIIILTEIPMITDTLKIVSSGTKNRVIIDSSRVSSGILKNDKLLLSGQIKQNGTSNYIEIFPAHGDTLKNKNRNKQTLNITQTGKNNSVKINSK